MKYLVKISGIAVALLVLLTACDKDEANETGLEGIYQGTLTGLTIKSSDGLAGQIDAAAKITITGDNEIQIHCYSEDFDSTFMMNYYHHNDSAFVCYTGDTFEEMYGHMLGNGHMGRMMDDMRSGETEWMHHMEEEHDQGDEHFGGFDMDSHHFSYTFRMKKNDSSDDLHFQGSKK